MKNAARLARPSAARRAAIVANAEAQIAGYEALLAVATEHGMAYEIERITPTLAELRADLAADIASCFARYIAPSARR